jgi:hypothetical protein
MRSLKFNFGHPVKGLVKLLSKVNPEQNRVLTLNTSEGETTEILIDGLSPGKWKVTLEWDHEERDFYFQQDFEIE